MGNSLRCCLACVLPCGALDVVRVVHLSGHVEEYSRHVCAGEILAANPSHVLSKPCSQGSVVRRILIVSPDSELRRGHIYFLIPTSTLPAEQKKMIASSARKRKQQEQQQKANLTNVRRASQKDDDYMTETTLADKKRPSSHRRHRSAARVGVWRPHLESICEDL